MRVMQREGEGRENLRHFRSSRNRALFSGTSIYTVRMIAIYFLFFLLFANCRSTPLFIATITDVFEKTSGSINFCCYGARRAHRGTRVLTGNKSRNVPSVDVHYPRKIFR